MEQEKEHKKSNAKQVEENVNHFLMLMNKQGLNTTSQRINIAKVFFSMQGHHSLEEIYQKVSRKYPGTGQTTVYRTVKLLCEVGLAEELQIGSGMARYETTNANQHHDHIICKNCGKTLEFNAPEIEKIQNEIANSHGFRLIDHNHILIGICSDCDK